MRVYLLFAIVAVLCVTAYRQWFVSLCGAILLMAVASHPDMPTNMFGVPGLNGWNILLVNVCIAWFIDRRRRGITWDLPGHINVLLVLYAVVVVIGFLRMALDPAYLEGYTVASMISEELINTLKWTIPGLLLFDCCREERRLRWGTACVLGLYLLLAIQVIRWMPISSAVSGSELTGRSRKIILNEIGYHPVNMSMMLGGASWAIFAAAIWIKGRMWKGLTIAAALAVVYAQALTAGRMGYVTWGTVGFAMCLMRWRKFMILVPMMVVGVSFLLPATTERMLQGFGVRNAAGDTVADDYEITSGRTLIWPAVIAKISESPIIGFGRRAMDRTGLANYLMSQHGESFPHPHNAYLQWLLDNGILGALAVWPLYLLVVYQAARMFLNREEPGTAAIGGICFALTLALLVASMGSQTFYPREGAVGMWCAFGLMFRVLCERQRRFVPYGLETFGPDRTLIQSAQALQISMRVQPSTL